MPAILSLVPLKDWIYGGIIVALLAGFGVYTVHERHLGAAHEVAALQKSSAALQAKAQEHIIEVAKAYTDSFNANEEKLNAQLQAASDQHDSDAQRLRDYDAYRSAHSAVARAANAPATPVSGASGTDDLEQRIASLEQVALSLADADRQIEAALAACIRDRDSLTGKP